MTIIFELITAVLTLVVGIVFIVSSLLLHRGSDFPLLEGPAIFPLLFAFIVSAIAVRLLAGILIRRSEELKRAMKNIKPSLLEHRHEVLKLAIIVGATFLYIIVLMPLLRFPISTFTYLTFCTIYFGKFKPWLAVVVSALFSIAVYFFFMKVLGIYLP